MSVVSVSAGAGAVRSTASQSVGRVSGWVGRTGTKSVGRWFTQSLVHWTGGQVVVEQTSWRGSTAARVD